MTPLEEIKIKIQKLLALQESAEKIGSLAEAANAAEKVQVLLMKYNLSLHEIGPKQEKSSISHMKYSMEDIGYNLKHGTWVLTLMQGVVTLNLCQMVTHTVNGKPHAFSILGEPLNIELSKFLYDQLFNKLKAMEPREWAAYQGYDLRGKFRRGFYMGAAMALAGRMREIARKMKDGQMEGVDGNACTALVLQSEKQVTLYMNTIFTNLRSGKARKANGSDGVGIGYAKGKEMSINHGVGGRPSTQLN